MGRKVGWLKVVDFLIISFPLFIKFCSGNSVPAVAKVVAPPCVAEGGRTQGSEI